MAFTHTLALEVLESIPAYVTEFTQVFGPDCINIEQVTDAIAEFEKTLVSPYETENAAQGVAGVTGKDADRFKFKVPTLRNVELTYPYFHDGEAATLSEAVDIMGRLQLGRNFEETDIEQIVAFLKSLTGEQPFFVLPELPPSTDKTPRPKPFG